MNKNLDSFLDNLLPRAVSMLPRFLLAIAIILIGYLVGRLVKKLVRRFILYLNERFNQHLQNRMLIVDLKSSATFISATFFWVIIILTSLICIQILELDFLSIWFDKIIGYIPSILVAVIIVFVGIISGRLLGDLIQSAALRSGFFNGKFLGNAIRYLIVFIAVVIAVDQLGVDIAFLTNLFIILLAALLFGASLAFGLGAKTSVSNILGSYYVRKSHQLGSTIRFGDTEGIIVKIMDHAIVVETKVGLTVVPAKDFNESKVVIIKDQGK